MVTPEEGFFKNDLWGRKLKGCCANSLFPRWRYFSELFNNLLRHLNKIYVCRTS